MYTVDFQCDKTKPPPLFGAKYNFCLEGVVDCPEFLVHQPTLRKLALKFGLECVLFERFEDFYERMKTEGRSLLGKIQALETYPPYLEAPLLGQNPGDYQHAVQYMQSSTGHRKIGTLSKPEWEATSELLLLPENKTFWTPVFPINVEIRSRSSLLSARRENNEENDYVIIVPCYYVTLLEDFSKNVIFSFVFYRK